jgi:transposase
LSQVILYREAVTQNSPATIRLDNRLKSCLKQYFPLALRVSGSRLTGNLACQLLRQYSRFERLQSASDEELQQFYREHHCYRQAVIDERIQIIRNAVALTTDRAIVESSELKVIAMVDQILALNTAIDCYDSELASSLRRHPNAAIFESLPGAGNAMAPRLLAAFGTDRDRFESAAQLQQMAGVAPVTKRSGKSHVVHRRWACNKFLLQTFHEYAAHSIRFSPWAKGYYDMLRARGKKHQAAIRSLAFKWVRIIFRCWKNQTTYDELIYCDALIRSKSKVVSFIKSRAETEEENSSENLTPVID